MDLDLVPAKDAGLTDSLREVRDAAEREHVTKVLAKCDWNITNEGGPGTGVNRPTLHDFIKKYQLSRDHKKE